MKVPKPKHFLYISIASVFLAHFFVSVGRSETIIDLLQQSWYYFDLFFVTIISFLVVTYVAVVHYSLDHKIPIRAYFTKRVLYQSLLGVAGPALVSFGLTFIYMEFILGQDIWTTTFLVYEFPISVIVILAMNLFFVIVTLMKPEEKLTVIEPKTTLIVTQAGKTLPVSILEIAGITKEGDYTLVCAFDGQKFVSNDTLEVLTDNLPASNFFRANRQWIIHKSTCGAYVTERSGKTILTLKEPLDIEISVSQKRAQEFKAWLAES